MEVWGAYGSPKEILGALPLISLFDREQPIFFIPFIQVWLMKFYQNMR